MAAAAASGRDAVKAMIVTAEGKAAWQSVRTRKARFATWEIKDGEITIDKVGTAKDDGMCVAIASSSSAVNMHAFVQHTYTHTLSLSLSLSPCACVCLCCPGGCLCSAKTYMAALPDTFCRYSVYDHEYKTKDGRTTSKLLFVAWCVRVAINACVATAESRE